MKYLYSNPRSRETAIVAISVKILLKNWRIIFSSSSILIFDLLYLIESRLRLIEIFDVKRLQMRYATSLIGGPSTLATSIAVYTLFGPTFPGIYDKKEVFTLYFTRPVLCFSNS
ncbi:hypothetical protein F2P56_024180 [Juglans regia]|uniref:Uncharacterized protein n=1 Tax=Juglans regia TaxID=51240 RepID=A0A833X0I8_JUGRE|nr:hypothetical protein F2P56_024180 [Juglans regia]